MKIHYECAAILALGITLWSCDTTEENYRIGDMSDISISTLPSSQLRIGADGSAREIEIKSNVKWHVNSAGNRFTVTPASGTGDGVITVSGPLNVNEQQTPTESLVISADEFDKSVTLEVIQSRLMFGLTDYAAPEAPEEGGEIKIRFKSSIAWRLKALTGQLDWFDFAPGADGEGDWDEITLTGIWLPNYSLSKRTAEIQLRPADDELLQYITLPASVRLEQQAGTLPEIVSASVGYSDDSTEATVAVGYASKSPVEEVGIRVYDFPYTQGSAYTAFTMSGEGLGQNGSASIAATGLTVGKRYAAIPYVRSKVGEKTGDNVLEVYPHFTGEPFLTDLDVQAGVRNITASYIVNPGGMEVTKAGFALFLDTNGSGGEQEVGQYMSSDLTAVGGDLFKLTVSTGDNLEPETAYLVQPLIEYTDPRTNEKKTVRGDKKSITTLKGRVPDEGDNKPITNNK